MPASCFSVSSSILSVVAVALALLALNIGGAVSETVFVLLPHCFNESSNTLSSDERELVTV